MSLREKRIVVLNELLSEDNERTILQLAKMIEETSATRAEKDALFEKIVVEPVKRHIKPWTQEDQESCERVSLFVYHTIMPNTTYAETIARLLQIVKNTLKDFESKEDQDQIIRTAFRTTPREALEILNDVMNEKEKQWQCLKTIEKLIPEQIALLRLDQPERQFIQKIGEILKDAKFSNRYIDFSDFSILNERANFGVFREQIKNAIPDSFVLKNWHNQTLTFIEAIKKTVV